MMICHRKCLGDTSAMSIEYIAFESVIWCRFLKNLVFAILLFINSYLLRGRFTVQKQLQKSEDTHVAMLRNKELCHPLPPLAGAKENCREI